MPKEPNTAKPVSKKLAPADAPDEKPAETAEIKGKVVRKDSAGASNTGEPAAESSKSRARPGKGKVVRKAPPANAKDATLPMAGETVAFQTPEDAEAAAEDILLGDDRPAEERTVAPMGETVETEATGQTEESAEPEAAAEPEPGTTREVAGQT